MPERLYDMSTYTIYPRVRDYTRNKYAIILLMWKENNSKASTSDEHPEIQYCTITSDDASEEWWMLNRGVPWTEWSQRYCRYLPSGKLLQCHSRNIWRQAYTNPTFEKNPYLKTVKLILTIRITVYFVLCLDITTHCGLVSTYIRNLDRFIGWKGRLIVY